MLEGHKLFAEQDPCTCYDCKQVLILLTKQREENIMILFTSYNIIWHTSIM